MCYVYKHTRKDNGEVFYIGIGLNSEDNYRRAYDIKGRNRIWYNIIKKTDYDVEILFDGLDENEVFQKEIELIKFYGRRIDKTGTLSNLTEGGEGFRKNHLEKSKGKIRDHFKNKTYEELHGENSEKEKNKRREGVKRYWDSLTDEERKKRVESSIGKGRGKKRINKEVPIECPHCKKIGRPSSLRKWHFENCKVLTGEKRTINDEWLSNIKNYHNKIKESGGRLLTEVIKKDIEGNVVERFNNFSRAYENSKFKKSFNTFRRMIEKNKIIDGYFYEIQK